MWQVREGLQIGGAQRPQRRVAGGPLGRGSQSDAPGKHPSGELLPWALIGVYFAASLADKVQPDAAFGVTYVLAAFAFALIHGRNRYGGRDILVFLAICLVISFSLENLSIVSGFPFGHYVYAGVPGPRLYRVPVLIALAYFGSGYLSWVVANLLLGKVDGEPRSSVTRFVLPLTAAFIMVMWDVGMDPYSSTVQRLWVWRDGGGLFGVPLSNFLGWFLTVFLFFELLRTLPRLETGRGRERRRAEATGSKPRPSTCWSS